MKKILLSLGLLCALNAYADTNLEHSPIIDKHKKILTDKFPGAEFTEIEKSRHKGQDIYEYEFIYQGQDYEAFLASDGKILRLGLD